MVKLTQRQEQDALQHSFNEESAASFETAFTLLFEPNSSTLEDLAVCSFMSNFVLIPRHREAFRGFLDALPTLFNNAPNGSVLPLATSALSLAIAGGRSSCSREAILSAKNFGKALVETNKAIRDPVESLKDETLMAVLVLSLYEVSLSSRMAHVT